MLLNGLGKRAGQRSMVKTPRILLDLGQRTSQLRLPEGFSRLIEISIPLEDASLFWEPG